MGVYGFSMLTDKTDIEMACKKENAWQDGGFDGGDDDFPELVKSVTREKFEFLQKNLIFTKV